MTKLITQTIIKNEENRFLDEWMSMLKDLADVAVILDDGSTDNTVSKLNEFKDKHKLSWTIISNKESQFKTNELRIRNQLWNEVRKYGKQDDWVLTIDSDEFDTGDLNKSKAFIFGLPRQIEVISLKKIETWDEKLNYRIDSLWSNYFTRLFRFKDEPFHPNPELAGLHVPSMPMYAITSRNILNPGIRMFHRAYEKEEWRIEKYKFMKENANPNDKINYEHVLSCIEPPELKKFDIEFDSPELNMCVLVSNKYTIQNYLTRLENMYYDCKKIKLLFIVDKCNYKVIEEIENFNESKFKTVDFMPINFEADDFNYADNKRRNKILYNFTPAFSVSFIGSLLRL